MQQCTKSEAASPILTGHQLTLQDVATMQKWMVWLVFILQLTVKWRQWKVDNQWKHTDSVTHKSANKLIKMWKAEKYESQVSCCNSQIPHAVQFLIWHSIAFSSKIQSNKENPHKSNKEENPWKSEIRETSFGDTGAP